LQLTLSDRLQVLAGVRGIEYNDGEIDYSACSLRELHDVEARIDATKNPKNYANLQKAIDRLLEQKKPVHQASSEVVSGKAVEKIAAEYKNVIQKQKVVMIVFLLFWLPNLVAKFSDSQTFLGVSQLHWLFFSGGGLLVLLWFVVFVLKCPSCGRSPGGGWTRQSCKSCGVSLRC